MISHGRNKSLIDVLAPEPHPPLVSFFVALFGGRGWSPWDVPNLHKDGVPLVGCQWPLSETVSPPWDPVGGHRAAAQWMGISVRFFGHAARKCPACSRDASRIHCSVFFGACSEPMLRGMQWHPHRWSCEVSSGERPFHLVHWYAGPSDNHWVEHPVLTGGTF